MGFQGTKPATRGLTYPPAQRIWVIFSPWRWPFSTEDPCDHVSHLQIKIDKYIVFICKIEYKLLRLNCPPSNLSEGKDTRLSGFWPPISCTLPVGVVCVGGGVDLWECRIDLIKSPSYHSVVGFATRFIHGHCPRVCRILLGPLRRGAFVPTHLVSHREVNWGLNASTVAVLTVPEVELEAYIIKFVLIISTLALPAYNHLHHTISRKRRRWDLPQSGENLQRDDRGGRGHSSIQEYNLMKRLSEGETLQEAYFQTSWSTHHVCSTCPILCLIDSLWFEPLLVC